MELLQMRYFQTLARIEHVTKAAEELSISQPSLSKTIHTLEKQLGVSLFDHKGKYIELNESGKLFLAKVDTILSVLDDGIRQLKIIKGEEPEQISLAMLAASPLLPELLRKFGEKQLPVQFHLLNNLSGSDNNNFDLCISALPLDIEGTTSMPLLTEEVFLAVPNGHKLASRKRINLKEAENEKFIQLKHGHSWREITDNFCHIAGFSPKIVFESDDSATVRGLINAGQGVGFVPAVSWSGTTGTDVTLLQIENPKCYRTIRLSWFENRYCSAINTKFRDFIIEFFQNMK